MAMSANECSYAQHGTLRWKCPYPVSDKDSGLCVFHATKCSKDADEFYDLLKPVIDVSMKSQPETAEYSKQQTIYYDIALQHAGRFCGFEFPDGVGFNECSLENADFSYAKFFGQVRFWNVTFSEFAKFYQAQFNCDSVSFDSTHFMDGFSFAGSSFNTTEGVFLNDLVCNGNEASFNGATFAGSYVTLNNVCIYTNIVEFSKMKVDCDGVFQVSGNISASESISFERSTFTSPIYLFSNLTSPIINLENMRFLDADDNKFQRSKFRARIESSTEAIWDKLSCAKNHEFALCKSRLVGNHLFTDCNYSKIIMSTCIIDKGADVLFQNCDMTNIHFYNVDLARISFLGCSWPKKHKVVYIADDPTEGNEIKGWYSHTVRIWNKVNGRAPAQSWVEQTQKKLAESERLYGQLKVKYDSIGAPALAGDFYFREMLMKSKRLGFINSVPLQAYYFLSGFGENWLRAGIIWLLIWSTGAYALMLNDSCSYVLESLRSMLLLYRDGSWSTTVLNILGPIQTGLLALAIKRKFKR